MLQHTEVKYFSGKVVSGQNVGHTIGFPTANLDQVPKEKDLKPGVYAGKAWLQKKSPLNKEETSDDSQIEVFQTLIFFGPRHIAGETKNVFEVHLLNFTGNLYGLELNVQPLHFIREPKKFKSLEELKEQLENDKEKSIVLMNKWVQQ